MAILGYFNNYYVPDQIVYNFNEIQELLGACKLTQPCWMLDAAYVCTPCCMLLDVVEGCCAKFATGQTLQPTTANISLFRDRRSVAQQRWIRLHSSSNIVGAMHAHYAWFTNLYMFHPEIGSGCKTLHGKHLAKITEILASLSRHLNSAIFQKFLLETLFLFKFKSSLICFSLI